MAGVTKAAAWAAMGREAAEATELTLPSGATILARRPSPELLAAWGYAPMSLAVAAAPADGPGTVSDEDTLRLVALYREILVFCCVQPRISLEPQGPDEIAPSRVPEADWKFLVRWATRQEEVESFRPFRGGSAPGDRGGNGEAVRTEAVDAARDLGPGGGAGDGPGGGVRVIAGN